MVKLLMIFITLITLFSSIITAQDFEEREINTKFKIALNLYDSGNYSESINLFDNILQDRGINHRTTISFIFKSKALDKLNRDNEALITLNQFLNLFPSSGYVDEARMMKAKIYIESEDYNNAFEELILLISSTNSDSYLNEAKKIAEEIGTGYVSSSLIENQIENKSFEKIKSVLMLIYAKAQIYNGNIADGIRELKDITNNFHGTSDGETAQQLYNSVTKNSQFRNAAALIGVMLPLNLSSDNTGRTPVTEILEGIKFAVSEFNRAHSQKIGLIIRDTKRDKSTINEIAQEFMGIPSIKTVIGPVYSDEVLETAQAFNKSKICIISPTATDNDLAGSNNNIYQANPSFSIRGKTMADYIFFVEKKNDIGVISSNSGYSVKLARAFIDEFQNLGGKIIAHEVYQPGSIEINSQADRLNQFRDVLQGFYVPIADANDAPVILSGLVLDSLYLPIYGNQDWYSAKGLETSTTISNNLIFTSDYYINFKDPAYIQFSKEFYSNTKFDANRNVLYGYDMTNYLVDVIFNSHNDINKINQILNSGNSKNGFHNSFLFDENHINKYLNILKYQNGVYEFVERYNSTN